MPAVIQLPSDCRSGLSTSAMRSNRPVTAGTCVITESARCIPRSSPTSSWTRPGSAEMSTYAVTMLLSSVSDDSSRESMGSSSLEVDQGHAPGARHLLQLMLDAVHGRREREHVLAHLHVGVGGERMPEDTVQVYSHLGHQVGHAQHQSLPGVTTACEWPNEMVFIRNTEGS